MPATNRIDGELRRVMVDAKTNPAGIGCHVIDAVGRYLAEGLVDEVVRLHQIGTALGSVIAATVLVLADEFLLLHIDRNDRLAGCLKRRDLAVDVLELAVAVRVVAALLGLAIDPRLRRGKPGGNSRASSASCRPCWH